MKFGIVIVETRSLPNLVDVIRNHLTCADESRLIIFCYDNEPFLKRYFPQARLINIGRHLNESTYNNLLTSKLFWEAIPYDKVLIFQHDSLILRGGIEDFLQYDYIGAPWKFKPYVGNGGLSIRSKQAMLDTIEKTPYRGEAIHGNEDVYFCNHLVGKLAPLEVAENFCVESIFKLGTFAYHAIDKYLTKDQVLQIKNQYK